MVRGKTKSRWTPTLWSAGRTSSNSNNWKWKRPGGYSINVKSESEHRNISKNINTRRANSGNNGERKQSGGCRTTVRSKGKSKNINNITDKSKSNSRPWRGDIRGRKKTLWVTLRGWRTSSRGRLNNSSHPTQSEAAWSP